MSQFREQELWTTDVNNLFAVNLEAIRKVLSKFKRPLTFECIEKMLLHQSRPRILSDKKDLVKAAALSK